MKIITKRCMVCDKEFKYLLSYTHPIDFDLCIPCKKFEEKILKV